MTDVALLGMRPGQDNSTIFQDYLSELPVGQNIQLEFGPGIWSISAELPRHFQIKGAGPRSTIFKVVAPEKPAFTIIKTNDWAYHGLFQDCSIIGLSPGFNDISQTDRGYGIAFGGINPLANNINLSYVGGVSLVRVYLAFLSHGIYMPYGNIGVNLDYVGIEACGYGIYNLSYLQATTPGTAMQPGVKSIENSRIGRNIIGAYFNNPTGQYIGNGGIAFKRTHFEQNSVALVALDNAPQSITPLVLSDCWIEGNGKLATTPINTATFDQWSYNGTVWTRTVETAPTYFAILDTPRTTISGCKVPDIHLRGTNNQIVVENCVMSAEPMRNGGQCKVDSPSSQIRVSNTQEAGGFGNADPGVVLVGYCSFATELDGRVATHQNARAFYLKQILNAKSLEYPSKIETYKTPVQTGTVVNDGIIYSQCNEYVISSQPTAQYVFLGNSFQFDIGYWVCTFNYKLVSGEIELWMSDGAGWQCARVYPQANNKWAQVGMIFHAPVATNSITLYGIVAANKSATIRMSAFQAIGFDTQPQAQDFLSDPVFIEPPANVKRITQNAHGFTQPCIAYIDAQAKYHLADRSDTAKIGTILIPRIIDVNTFEVAIASRVYNIAVTNPVPNKTVYLSATPGGLTCDPPGVSETIVRLGELQETNQFYWNPDKRQGVGQ